MIKNKFGEIVYNIEDVVDLIMKQQSTAGITVDTTVQLEDTSPESDVSLSVESTLDMIAAISPAKTNPIIPTGSTSVTRVGNTVSAFSKPGKRLMAIAPGMTMMNSGNIFRKPAKITPHLACLISLAPKIL